jgi:predicted nuclease of predicted toxin-antitoxin system
MRLLVDENLSVRVADAVRRARHDVVHVTEVGLGNTDDEDILVWAAVHDRVIVTSDADFGTLLALGRRDAPSVVLLRSSDHLTPDEQGALLLLALGRVSDELASGAVASVSPERIRIRALPIH